MIYAFLKILIKLAIKIFFSNVEVINKKVIPKKGALIVVANHPNTFMDPILIATQLKQQVYFLAKSTVFGSPIQNWVLSHIFNMIPVYRKADLPKGSQNDNNAIFEKCFEFLAKGGTLLIFPEGTSVLEKKLREIKTGTARIALGAENSHDFNLGVQILPIGLNYTNAQYFRSKVTLNVSKPINVKEFKESFIKNDRNTISLLTENIKNGLEEHLILAKDKNHELLLAQAGNIITAEFAEKLTVEGYQLEKEMANALTFYEESDASFIEQLQEQLSRYYRKLAYLNLQDHQLSKSNLETKLVEKIFSVSIFLIVGLPLWLIGVLTNYIPYILPSKVASKVSKYVEFRAPVMMVTGMFTYGIHHTIAIILLWKVTSVGWLALCFLPIAAITGFFALYYWNTIEENLANLKLLFIFKKNKQLIETLIEERKAIYFTLKQAMEGYTNR